MRGTNLAEKLKLNCELFHGMEEKVSSMIRVSCPGIVQDFDSARQTVTVQLALREKVVAANGLDSNWEDIPPLVDVHACAFRAGGFIFTLPYVAGDEVLVIFGDCCIDAWWQSGGVQNQMDKRRHDLSDGFALPMVWSQPRKITGYSASSAQIRSEDGATVIDVASGLVTINAGEVALGDVYANCQKLIDERFKATFDDHIHMIGGVSTGVPTVALDLSTNATSKTKAV